MTFNKIIIITIIIIIIIIIRVELSRIEQPDWSSAQGFLNHIIPLHN